MSFSNQNNFVIKKIKFQGKEKTAAAAAWRDDSDADGRVRVWEGYRLGDLETGERFLTMTHFEHLPIFFM